MLIKQKSPSLPRNLSLETFGELQILFSTKVNLLFLLSSIAWIHCLLHLIKQNYLLKTFLRTHIFDTSGMSLPVFLAGTNLKFQHISVAPKIVEKVITNLDSSKASHPDCILVVVLNNWATTLIHITELFNTCLK